MTPTLEAMWPFKLGILVSGAIIIGFLAFPGLLRTIVFKGVCPFCWPVEPGCKMGMAVGRYSSFVIMRTGSAMSFLGGKIGGFSHRLHRALVCWR
jgi:hypothetical protein